MGTVKHRVAPTADVSGVQGAGRRAPAPRSRVGQKLSNLTTSRVVVLVLSMLFVLPAFNIGGGMYGSPPDLGLDGVKVPRMQVHMSATARVTAVIAGGTHC